MLRSYLLPPAAFLISLLIVSCGSLKLPSNISGDHIRTWQMFGKDAAHSSTVSMRSSGLDSLWEFDADAGFGNFSPTIDNGVVCIGTLKGDVYLIDLKTGKSIGSKSFGGALFSSPVIHDSLMIVAASGIKDNFFGYDLVSGKIIWTHQIGDVESAPTESGDYVYVTTVAGDLYRFDIQNGEQKFHRRFGSAIRVSPALSDTMCVFGSDDGEVRCVNSESGKDIWSYNSHSSIWCSASIADSIIIVGTDSGMLLTLNLHGEKLSEFKADGKIVSMPLFDGKNIYFGSAEGNFYAVGLRNGDLVWKISTDGPIISSAAQDDNQLFFGSFDRHFYVVNKSDGTVAQKFDLDGRVRTAPAISGNYLVVCAENSNVFGFRIR